MTRKYELCYNIDILLDKYPEKGKELWKEIKIKF